MGKENMCPVGECDRMRVVEDELFDRTTGIKVKVSDLQLSLKDKICKQDVQGTLRFYLGLFLSIFILCAGSLIGTWSQAKNIPELKESLRENKVASQLNKECNIRQDEQMRSMAEQLSRNNEINTNMLAAVLEIRNAIAKNPKTAKLLMK